MNRTRWLSFAALACVLMMLGGPAASAQVFPEREACLPTTSATARDANCARCQAGPLSTNSSFLALIEKLRNRGAIFDDVDRRIDTASPSKEVNQLLKGRALAKALYGSDADFIAGGAASRCVPFDDEAAVNSATPFPCENIPREGLGVIITAGQSNISNTGSPDKATGRLYQPAHVFYNYNYLDGKCYIAKNPLLGTAGGGENVAVRLGDELISRKLYKNIVIAPVAIGGTYLEEWRPRGGKYFEIVLLALAGLRDVRLEPTAMLWHQGEFNAFAFTTGGAEDGTILNVTTPMREAGRLSYLRNYLEIVAALRAADVTAPIFVAQATRCGGPPDDIIRSAQASVPNSSLGVFAGPDTDSIGAALRSDGCHMAHAGTQQHAKMWADILANAIKRQP
ncbi:MAG: sialate O-acetylesterase [Tardiphaga sp.]